MCTVLVAHGAELPLYILILEAPSQILGDAQRPLRRLVVQKRSDPPDLGYTTEEGSVTLQQESASRQSPNARRNETYALRDILQRPPRDILRHRLPAHIHSGDPILHRIIHVRMLDRLEAERELGVRVMARCRVEVVRVVAALLERPAVVREVVLPRADVSAREDGTVCRWENGVRRSGC